MEKRAEEKKKSDMKEPEVVVKEVADDADGEEITDSVTKLNQQAPVEESAVGEAGNKENTGVVTKVDQQEPVKKLSHDGITHQEKVQETLLESTTTATATTKSPSPGPSNPDSAVDIVVTESLPTKTVESTSAAMTSSTLHAADATMNGEELPSCEPAVTGDHQEEVSEPREVTKEQDQISSELDAGLQDSEQDSSSVNETGSPSHETSTTTIDIQEDIDSADLKTNVEVANEAEMIPEDETNPANSKDVNLPPTADAEQERDDQKSSTDAKAVGENEPEPVGLEMKPEEASEDQETNTTPETLVSDRDQIDTRFTIEADDIKSNQPQSIVDSMSDEPSGNSSATERPVDQQKSKRKALIKPIQISNDISESDDDNLLSDDSFMDELTSATVQEAQPVSVGKSPIMSSFAGNDNEQSSRPGSRAVSNPNFKPSLSGDLQALPIGRSASGSYFDRSEELPVLVAKKVNVSSGISKRIKALEMFSGREPSPALTAARPSVSPAPSSSAFEKFRKRASISQSNLPSGLTPASKPGQTLSPSTSSETTASKTQTPNRNDSVSVSSSNRGKSNSVSVTARIIRDNSASQSELLSDHQESNVLNLQCSPLTVERDTQEDETPVVTQISTAPKSDNRSLSVSSGGESRRSSFASILPRSDSTASRLSGSSRTKTEAGSRLTGDLTSSPLDSVDEAKEEKRDSRKSRFLRRMSSITSNSRRGVLNSLSPTVTEEEAPPSPAKEEELTPVPPQLVDIGEVNVQFPDTLLWKRRFMRIDDQGYIILTPGNMDMATRNIVKRYHLSEFRTPCLPDHDRQELPNSIILDFCDGNTLQCACESRQGQIALLQSKIYSSAR